MLLALKNLNDKQSKDDDDNEEDHGRGDVEVTDVKVENFILVYGCPPDVGVKANTMMIYDLADAMDQGYEKVMFKL